MPESIYPDQPFEQLPTFGQTPAAEEIIETNKSEGLLPLSTRSGESDGGQPSFLTIQVPSLPEEIVRPRTKETKPHQKHTSSRRLSQYPQPYDHHSLPYNRDPNRLTEGQEDAIENWRARRAGRLAVQSPPGDDAPVDQHPSTTEAMRRENDQIIAARRRQLAEDPPVWPEG